MSAVPTLCAAGLAMGVVHVLTGPDHLSAIATLSVNVGNCRAFMYGVRWGVGHSIGLVLVGSVFIALENINYVPGDDDNGARVIEVPERLENAAACFVGIFMMALGLYNLYRARQNQKRGVGRARRLPACGHKECRHSHDEHADRDPEKGFSCDPLTASAGVSTYGIDPPRGHMIGETKPEGGGGSGPPTHSPPEIDGGRGDDASRRLLSLWVGIFHGVAGPGGVLGVVPAARLHDAWHSAAYLSSFCASSILVMGCFAALYGSLSATWTKHDDGLAYRMEVFSASLSLLVGCTWLVLLYLGILDEVFP